MKTFAQKIKALLKGNAQEQAYASLPLDFVKSKRGILKEFILSKQSGNAVGIYCRALGEGMFITVVEEIEQDANEHLVSFNQYDMSGAILSRFQLALGEIQMVCPLHQRYRHPVFTGVKGVTTY
jgi:hypothetical protein